MANKARNRRRPTRRVQKKKANTKLLSIIGISVGVILFVVGGLWFFNEYRGAARNVNSATELIAEGDYNAARKQLGRAVTKEPSNIEYIRKLKEVILKITPSTPDEARALYNDYISTLMHQARYNPTDIDAQLMVVEEMYNAAYLSSQSEYWRKLREATIMGLDRINPNNPRKHELMLYRGLSALHIEDASMIMTYDDDGNVRFPGEDDIEYVLEKDPGNPIAWSALAHGRMAIYYRMQNEGRAQQAIKNKTFADETMSNSLAVVGSSFDVLMTYMREILLQRNVLLQQYVIDPDKVSSEQLEIADQNVLETREKLLASFDPNVHQVRIGELITLIVSTGNDGAEVSIPVLERHMETHPQDTSRNYMLAAMYRRLGRFADSTIEAQKIIDGAKQTVGIYSIEQYATRPLAAHLLLQLTIEQAMKSEDESEKKAFITQAQKYFEVLSDLVSHNDNHPMLIYGRGLIALANNDYVTAAKNIEEVISKNPSVSAQVYREAAIALAESGAKGLASDRLATALSKEPSNLSNYILKARMEIMIFNYEEAERTLSALTPLARAHEQVIELLNVIELKKGTGSNRFTDPILQIVAEVDYSITQAEYEVAISLVDKGIETHGDDWRLFAAKGNVYLSQNDNPNALYWIQKALEENPESEYLTRFVFSLESDDPIDAFEMYIETLGLEPGPKSVRLAAALYAYAMERFAESKRWELTGYKSEAETHRELAEKSLAQSKKYQEQALALDADLTDIIIIEFDQSIINKDFKLANSYIDEMVEMGIDETILQSSKIRLNLFKAIQAKQNGNQEIFEEYSSQALDSAKALTESMPFSDRSWSSLAAVYNEIGDHKEAAAAYGEAYRIAPNGLENIKRYIGALSLANDEPQRLLRIMRLAIKQYPSEQQLKNAWLEIETRIGDRGEVFKFRLETYRIRPDNRENAIAFASFLVNQTPSREFILNKDGTEQFTTRAWDQLQPAQQKTELANEKDSWVKIVDKIMAESEGKSDLDIRSASQHAGVARDRGQMDSASEIWDLFLNSLEDTEQYTTAVIAAADFLQQSGRIEQAITLLENAKSDQSEDKEIEAALGSVLFNVGRYEDSAVLLGHASMATNNRILHARWIESLALSGQFNEAENAMESYQASNVTYSDAMLRSLVSRVKSEQLLAQGDIEGGMAELTKYRNALRVAISVDEENPIPYIHFCKSLLNEYHLTQDKALLEEAIIAADEGSKNNADSEEFAVVRTDVLQADGQILRAIDRLSTHLSKFPEANIVRQRLVEAYLDTNEIDRALKTTQDGVSVNNSDALWHRRLGDLYVRANDDRAKAILAYLEALSRDPNVAMLIKIDEITRTNQVIPNQALLKMTRGPLAQAHPIVGAIEAKVLLNLDRRRDALIAMTRSWNAYKAAVEQSWIPETATSNWYLDLRHIFDNDSAGGEAFIRNLAGSQLTGSQIAGLAGYYQAFGDAEHANTAINLLQNAVEKEAVGSNIRARMLMLLGGFLVEAKQYDESVVIFKQLSLEQDSPLILNNLAYVVGVYQNKPEAGLAIAKRAAIKAPRVPQIIDTVATLYERIGDAKKASETLEFLLQISPANADAMSKLALLYAGPLSQPERAVVFAERARSQNPRSAEVLDALGWSYYQTGRTAKGEEFLQKSLKREETENAYVHMAQLVTATGDFEEALGYLRLAEELSQDAYSLNRIKGLQDDIRNKQAAIGG